MKEQINDNPYLDMLNDKLGVAKSVTTLYHYTSLQAFLNGILHIENGNATLRFHLTRCDYLNDRTELMQGKQVIQEYYSKNKQEDIAEKINRQYVQNDLYCLSLSTKADVLPMWGMYGQQDGICIGVKVFYSLSPDDILVRCCYNENRLKQKIESLNKGDLADLLNQHFFIHYAPYILKHSAYRFEHEARLIGTFKDQPIKYKYSHGQLIPYKEIIFPIENLKQIIIGPQAAQNRIEENINEFLKKEHVVSRNIKIKKSDIPYR